MPDIPKKQLDFSRILLKWNREKNNRPMPWKGEKDPYKIWLSEIILQQTRVGQGLAYYTRFIHTFPNIRQLALAPDEEVFKLWEGLGYYSRCRNLIATARFIARELGGHFPSTYDSIIALKGIGPYTAAAISSFAYNLPHAVVDGNVFRVLSRIFGISTPIDSTAGKKEFTFLADQLLDKKQPGLYNQAIMDFGAVICKPAPACDLCPFQKDCYALRHEMISELPVKEKKIVIRKRHFYYFVIEHDGQKAIQQRTAKDIWQQLYEFPLLETGEELKTAFVLSLAEKATLLKKGFYELKNVSQPHHQQLSHQFITAVFINIKLKTRSASPGNWAWIAPRQMDRFTFPRLINDYLGKK